jgi:hypothetical protein
MALRIISILLTLGSKAESYTILASMEMVPVFGGEKEGGRSKLLIPSIFLTTSALICRSFFS